jgi:PTH1 family peptidyl-tRNA hydrolase
VASPELIVLGLGNPGAPYAQTRHNVGFWCVDRIASDHSVGFSRRNRSALVGEGLIEGRPVVLAKPRTFVNLSGLAAAYLLTRFRASPQELLIIYDDMDLPLGRLRLRLNGTAGGHNGIKSIIETVGTQDIPRLRVGIGQPPPGSDQVEYVLGTMSAQERETVDQAVDSVAEAVRCLLTDGIVQAMNRFN